MSADVPGLRSLLPGGLPLQKYVTCNLINRCVWGMGRELREGPRRLSFSLDWI